MRIRWIPFAMASLIACTETGGERSAPVGEALPGLNTEELDRFVGGRILFDHEFTEEQGLGPLFNQRRCSSCHDVPTLGGAGAETVAKATHFVPPDRCDLLESDGGDLIQRSATPALQALGVPGEIVPSRASAVATILPPQLYGLGLVEAIRDRDILAREDPDDDDGDGISGRAVRLPDGRLGRFGRKLQFATLREFIEDALRGEMGITTPRQPTELTVNGQPVPAEADAATDPEMDAAGIDALTDYVRLLAAPDRELPATTAARDSIAEGELLFGRIGCAACHTPRFTTGPSDVDALHRRPVLLYSDLLLHDMGEELASVCGRYASPSEWRTTPLAGLRHRHALLHHGRGQGFARVIEAHGGEGARSRDAFARLSPEQQAALLRFLASL